MKDLIIEKMYEWSKKPYQKFFKKSEPWNVTPKELILYPQESLGFHMGCFLLKYNFEMQPKLEDHDVIHVLTNTGVSVIEEIGMQYYLWGNGKKSAYMYMVIFIGTLFYPAQFNTFWDYYKRGQKAHHFYDLDFEKMLHIPVKTIQSTFNIK
ncbi:Coq4 family protein [Flavobacterium sp. 102]|uniref:Coq4 family protein n=1 Tax=Flavobacterium sp. 102 TaxID=2135623 RepID=UPI000EAED964|nr:Coq4 family protein [Flavobacterium sp. 102]RKS02264.1 ubiquinone biosynthesis protein COQ4 [Flavobacterium sp. 102]